MPQKVIICAEDQSSPAQVCVLFFLHGSPCWRLRVSLAQELRRNVADTSDGLLLYGHCQTNRLKGSQEVSPDVPTVMLTGMLMA